MPAIRMLLHALTALLSRPQWARLGLTLLHFLWEGALIAVAAEGTAVALRLRPGRQRYSAYLLGMIVMALCPIVTYRALPQLVVADGAAEAVPHFGGAAREMTVLAPAGPEAVYSRPVLAGPRPAAWDETARAWLLAALPWASAAWAAGVIVLAFRLLAGLVGILRLRRGAVPLSPPLLRRVDHLAERLGARGYRGVFASERVSHPCAVGLWRPVVLLPAALLTGMPAELLEAVIAHELAHIRRLDLWANLGQRVVETLLFYHPAVWWLSARVRREREVCCDDAAAGATERETCARALEHVARHALGLPGGRAEGFVLAFGRSADLLYRVRHLLGTPADRPRAGWPAGALAIIVIAAGIAITRSSSSAQAPQPPASTTADAQPAPATSPAAGADALPTPAEAAREEARKQAARDVRRAELSVEEAQLTLEEKDKELCSFAKGHEQHTVSDAEFDRVKLDASLARIRLERSKLDLDDAQAKFQVFIPSSITLTAALLVDHDPRKWNAVSHSFSVGSREVTLKQLLVQVRKTLKDKFEMQSIGRVTVTRDENSSHHKIVDGVLVQDALEGKAGEVPLRAGDYVEVTYEKHVATNVVMTVNYPGLRRGSGSYAELPRRDMTVTQAVAAYIIEIDPKSMAEAKITLEREGKKVFDAVPMRDLLDGKVKDEVIQSNDRIRIDK